MVNRLALYLIYVFIFWVFLYLGYILHSNLKINAINTFNHTAFFFFETIFYIVAGMYLSLPRFFQQIKKEGNWKINILKLVFIGLPTSYILFFAYLANLTPLTEFSILFYPISLFLGFPFFVMINGVLLGFIIFDSIYKVN